MKPVVGITFSRDIGDDPSNNYIKTTNEFGGTPRRLYPGISEDAFDGIDGLLLSGGGDIHPSFFGEPWHPSLLYVSKACDELELSLCRQAIADDIPVLGICRGIQVMSIAMGGNLYQDISSEYPRKAVTHKTQGTDVEHEIQINPSSRLSELVGKDAEIVNSAHHQAVKDIGDGFVVSAHCREDGIIEAIENPSKRFVIGVQYHPERMLGTNESLEHRRKLFHAFIQAASSS